MTKEITKILAASVLSIICVSSFAFAQRTAGDPSLSSTTASAITGRITDPQGAGVPGSIVTLYERARPSVRLATTTDETGIYRFARLAPGEYILEAAASGFTQTAAGAVRVRGGGAPEETLDIALELAGVRAEVVVTASDAPQTVDEVSKAITVVGRREIDDRDEFLIAEALRSVPGLRVQQLGGPGTLTSIKTRGLRNQDTAVLIDGLRFRDTTALTGDASSFLGDLIVTNTSRVEVLRGSGSSLYGTNAIGGVVNVVTDEGGGPLRGNLLIEGGGLGLFRGRAQVAGGAAENRVVYSAGATHLNATRGIDEDDAARNTSGQGRVLFRLTPTATLTARIYTADAFVQLNDNPQAVGTTLPAFGIINAIPLRRDELRRYETGARLSELNTGAATFVPSANDSDNTQATRFFSGAITFAQRLTETFGYTVSYQGLITDRTFRDGPGRPGNLSDPTFAEPSGSTRSDFDGRIQTINARTDFRLGRANFITAGYEFERETFINRSFPVNLSETSTVNVVQRSQTLFVQDQLRLMEDRLQLSGAFRAQFFSVSQPQFTPAGAAAPYRDTTFVAPPRAYTGDGSVAYFFGSTGTKVRAHVGNGYRAPSLFERFGTFYSGFSNSFVALGDPTLRPERSIAFDAGLDQTLYGNRLRASATYFYTRLQEVIDFGDVSTFGRIFGGFLNRRGGLARGAELSLTAVPWRTLDLAVAYTYTNADQRTPVIGDVIRSFAIPDHQFSLVATQRIGRRLLVNFDLTAASEYLAPVFDPGTFASRVYRFDGPIKADLGASYTLPLTDARSVRFFGKLDNLFEREYFENGFRTPRRTGVAGAALSF